jgi:hypothetical protein
VTSQINVQFTSFVYNMLGSKVTRLYSPKNNRFVICDKKNLQRLVIWYDFYPTRCVFSVPSPRLGDRKHKTCWIKIISNHKPWEIVYIWRLLWAINVIPLTVRKIWSGDYVPVLWRPGLCWITMWTVLMADLNLTPTWNNNTFLLSNKLIFSHQTRFTWKSINFTNWLD